MDAKKLATFEDLLSVPEDQRAELINGEIIYNALPTVQRHGIAQGELRGILHPLSRRGGGGDGGWWIVTEAGVRYSAHDACVHDLAGWKRQRMPEPLDDVYVTLTPDWVCEIPSPSNRNHDLVRKKAILHKAQVPYYWVIDLADKILAVHRWHADGYLNIANCVAGDRVKLAPFEEVEVDVSYLMGD